MGSSFWSSSFWSSSILVVFHFGRLQFGLSSILVVFHFGRLPFWSSSILVVFHFDRLPFGVICVICNLFDLICGVPCHTAQRSYLPAQLNGPTLPHSSTILTVLPR